MIAPGTRPPCLIEIALEPTHERDRPALCAALAALAADEDYSCEVACDAESGQIVLKGQNELHLDVLVDCLRKRDGLDLRAGAPQIAYRETMTKRIETDYTYKTQVGGAGAFARVKLVFEPGEDAGFVTRIDGGAMPDEFISGVARGIASVMHAGIHAGFPVVGVAAILIDGAYHDTDSSAAAFEIAAREAFREALRDGGPVLLEPIMTVEVTTPEAYTGFVVGDLLGRRGQVQDQDMRGTVVVVNAVVPLANMFGYVNQLRSGTQGYGHYTMAFSHYATVDIIAPPDPRFPPVAMALRRIA